MKSSFLTKSLLVISIFLILYSCEKTVSNVNIPDTGRKIIVNSVIEQDSLIAIQLHKSKYIMDNNDLYEPVQDAVIDVYKNNELIETITQISESFYYSTTGIAVQAGDNYKIEVTAPGFPKVTTQTVIPNPVRIISIDTVSIQRNISYNGWDHSESELECNIEFTDPSNEDNYYYLTVKRYFYSQVYEPYDPSDPYSPDERPDDEYIDRELVYVNQLIDIYSDELEADDNTWTISGILFSDDLFDGEKKKFSFNFSKWNMYSSDSSKISILLNSISKEYYLYLKSYIKYEDSNDFGPFAEPVNVYSNIDGGYGILGSSSVLPLELEGIIIEEEVY